MAKFGVSQPVTRKEDTRFLTGKGQYVDDLAPKGALHMVFVRSSMAHARIVEVDAADAREAEGVVAVITAADFDGKMLNAMDFSTLTNRDGSKAAAPVRPVLASDTVRYVGEAVAAVVAETREQALDAAEMVMLDLEDLPVSVAPRPGGATIHPEAPHNRAYDWAHGDAEAVTEAFEAAAHKVSLDIADNRVFADPMEPRGCYAEIMDDGRLHLAVNGQGVWGMKRELAKKLGLAADDVRVTNPDVGGGFGMKGFNYPENFAVAFAARALGRPVRWMADRSEGHLTDAGGRALETVAEAAFDADHRLTGLRIKTYSDLGAYNSPYGQFIQSELALKVFTGCYDIQTALFEVEGVYTNTTPVD
ncbi:MAG: molybdopterin cofactor-binding domain-containing protein, partial [Pseudomonadota bacterium]